MTISADVMRRIDNTARRLDRVYCGGFGNEVDAIKNQLVAVALNALATYDAGRCA